MKNTSISQEQPTEIENLIWRWLDRVVINENFCPFAKQVRDDHAINLKVINDTSQQNILRDVHDEMRFLLSSEHKSTSIIALSRGFEDFFIYLDLVDAVTTLIEQEQLSGIFQCASFHPDYLFADEPTHDASHYTNRAPLPLLHIIDEKDISSALASFKHPENIPLRNKAHARKLGKSFFKPFLS